MRVVLFCHSLVSDWNHGNAHFLRGVATELLERGAEVSVFEPADGWSRRNLMAAAGPAALDKFHAAFPHLSSRLYDASALDLDEALENADVVVVHEWNQPELIRRLGRHRSRVGRYRLLFHDTHHRSVTEANGFGEGLLAGFDGVLAFGEAIRERYVRRGWAGLAWTWHEAADTRVFRPIAGESRDSDVVWIGNWGDGERTRELSEYLLKPVLAARVSAHVYGVRYPVAALRRLAASGIRYGGWLPNYEVPRTFARHRATVHIPRRPYARKLPGIPTIRVFEALACGIPLVCAPWQDSEGLFSPGRDYLVAASGDDMRSNLRALVADEAYAREIAANGLKAVEARHTCSHRVDELLSIAADLGVEAAKPLLDGGDGHLQAAAAASVSS